MSYKNQCGNRNLALNQEAGDWNRLEFAENVKAKSQRNGNKNKKEVKTEGSHLPGWGGVLLGNLSGGHAVLPCQAGLRPHSLIQMR